MKKLPWKTFVPLALFVCLVAAMIVALDRGNAGGNKFALHIGEAAPTTLLPSLADPTENFDMGAWRGRAYLINFFASWCVPCHAEHGALMALAKDEHIPVIGIAYKDKLKAATGFLTD